MVLFEFGSLTPTLIICLVFCGGSFTSNHESIGKKKRSSGRVTATTSTYAQCHPLPMPVPSWPISIAVSFPRSGKGPTSKTSSAPRSKLFLLLLSLTLGTDLVGFPSFSPMSVMLTLASVPANMTSDVCTVTL